MKRHIIFFTLVVGSVNVGAAQAGEASPEATPGPSSDSPVASPEESRPYYVGTTLLMLANLVPDDYPPVFYQLNAGYRLTPNDRISLEAITWRYYHPLGIPWGKERESAAEEYPGHIREYGIGPAYKRHLWKGIYTSLSAVPFWREYYDTQGNKIRDGFELFLTFRLGYYHLFFDRVFVEPSVAFTWWPISTNVPAGFAAKNATWPSYFLFEPGLHLGVVF